MHSCRGYKMVMDPAEYRSFLQASASHPLDRLSVGDLTTIYEGKDEADAVFRRAEEQFEESNARYFQEPLVYRFEFESISAVSGFRPSFDGSAILTEGHADKDWDGVLVLQRRVMRKHAQVFFFSYGPFIMGDSHSFVASFKIRPRVTL